MKHWNSYRLVESLEEFFEQRVYQPLEELIDDIKKMRVSEPYDFLDKLEKIIKRIKNDVSL